MKTVIKIVTHGDFDGAASAAIIAAKLLANGVNKKDIKILFTQPFLVDQVEISDDTTHVFVCDIAVNNRNLTMTVDFIARLGDKLVELIDHHEGWDLIGPDNRFNIATSAPACAVIASDGSATVTRSPRLQEVVMDAIVADTRKGTMSPNGQMIEDAMKSNLSNDVVKLAAVKLMMGDESQRPLLKDAAKKYAAVLDETNRLANNYDVDEKPMSFFRSGEAGNSQVPGKDYTGKVAVVDTRESNHKYDLTQLLLAGQKLATFAVAKTVNPHTGDENITIATKSSVNLVELFDLGSGAPFRVSLPIDRFTEAIEKLEKVA